MIRTEITNEANTGKKVQEKRVSNDECNQECNESKDSCCAENPDSCCAAKSCCKSPIAPPAVLDPKTAQGGRKYELPEGIKLEDCTILYIGIENVTLTNIMMVHNKCPVIRFDPEQGEAHRETVQVNRLLMKRYFLVQKAKDADVIGIVVGTLGVGE